MSYAHTTWDMSIIQDERSGITLVMYAPLGWIGCFLVFDDPVEAETFADYAAGLKERYPRTTEELADIHRRWLELGNE